MRTRRFYKLYNLATGLGVAGLIYASAGVAANLDVIGELAASGPVTVTAPGAAAPMHLTDTTYAYVSGDRVTTGKGNATLALPDIGGLGFAPHTQATVSRAGEGIDVTLEAGTVAYAIHPNAHVRIHAAGAVLSPVAEALRSVSEAGDKALMVGWISVGEDGLIEVYAHSGRTQVRYGDAVQFVETGTRASFQSKGERLIPMQAEGAAAGGPNWLLILGAVAVVGGGIAAGVTLSGGGGGGTASP